MLTYLSLIFIVAYLFATYFKAGKDIPESISSTYFVLDKKEIFSLTIIVSSIMLLLPFHLVTPGYHLFFPYLGVIGMIMVGIFPNTEDLKQLKLHMIGGVGGCICFNIWTSLIQSNWYILIFWILFILMGYWLNRVDVSRYKLLQHLKEHIIFWAEVFTLLGVYSTLIIYTQY
jgi:hypothetical protein